MRSVRWSSVSQGLVRLIWSRALVRSGPTSSCPFPFPTIPLLARRVFERTFAIIIFSSRPLGRFNATTRILPRDGRLEGGHELRHNDRQLADHVQADQPARRPGARQRSRGVRGQLAPALHHREVRQLCQVSTTLSLLQPNTDVSPAPPGMSTKR